MAVVYVRTVSPGVSLGLWHLTETAEEIVESFPHLATEYQDFSLKYKSKSRLIEKMAVRALLAVMCENEDEQPHVNYNENGKPLLSDGRNISISHTTDYVSVIISQLKVVAVDVEMIRERIERVAKHFLRDDEIIAGLKPLTIAWCAKETIYKLKSSEHLQTSEMRINNFPNSGVGRLEVEDMRNKEKHVVFFESNDNYVLAYSF